MESSWRQNVPAAMMVGSGWELCARIAGSPTPIFLVKDLTAPGVKFLYLIPNPNSLPTLVSMAPVTPDHPHFPWGAIVLPD